MEERIANYEAGIWGVRRGRFYDLVICGPARWKLVRAKGGWDSRQRTLVKMGREEALGLLIVWGFTAAEIWQADDFCQQQFVTSAAKSLTLHASSLASPLLKMAPSDSEFVH